MPLLTLGQPWPEDYISLPTNRPTFGWHRDEDGINFLVLSDPFGDIASGDTVAEAKFEIGFAQHGLLAIIAIRSGSPGWPFQTMESPRPYLKDDTPPEINVDPAEHMLWSMTTVRRGIIVNMRAFTTSPEVTVFLRRVFAEQRAHGPISIAEADQHITRWEINHPTEESVWSAVSVRCHAGD